jgi:hypothetical protein
MKDFVLYYDKGFIARKLQSEIIFDNFFANMEGYEVVFRFEKHNLYSYANNCVMKMNIKVTQDGVKIEPTKLYGGY